MALPDSKKRRISYREVHELVAMVCGKVIKDHYQPQYLITIGTGGYVPGRIAKTFFEQGLGIKNLPLYSIGYSNYDENNKQLPKPVMTQRLDEDLEKKIKDATVLLIDEVDQSRLTLEDALRYLLETLGAKEVRVMVLHSKKIKKQGVLPEGIKIYHAEEAEGNVWIDYQWEFIEFF